VTPAFDTNVLIYAIDIRNETKRARATDVIARAMRAGGTLLLYQTLGEFSRVALRQKIPVAAVRARLDVWRHALPILAAAPEDLADALDAVRDHRLSFWDAMLWATAARVGVTHLFSEDFQDGSALGPVRFINPFAAKNDALIDALLPR
jgi:predicted nucleic acid-binding protein